MKYLGAMTSIP